MQSKTRGRKFVLALVGGTIGALAIAAPALATTVSAGGGTWSYGVTDVNYSNYYQPTVSHRSSVNNPLKGLVRSGCVGGGSWSYASEAASTQDNQAFWSVDSCA